MQFISIFGLRIVLERVFQPRRQSKANQDNKVLSANTFLHLLVFVDKFLLYLTGGTLGRNSLKKGVQASFVTKRRRVS